MDRCVVSGNICAGEPGQGGGIFETNCVIRDSLIVSNTSTTGSPFETGFGGGVYMQGGALVNCTLADNAALAQGGDVFIESGGITNSIIFDNSGNVWTNAGSGIFDRCCTMPDPGGVGNIVQDPQFVASTNFHLTSTSPCIAAGLVQSWMTGAFDLDGNPRTTKGVVDMGAYQSPPSGVPVPVKASFVVSPRSGEAPLTVQFKDASTGPVADWNWSFGDGATSALQNPSHTYFDGGDHMATLAVTGSGGSSTNAMMISVRPRKLQLSNVDGL
jgi:PKD repeat protein